MKTFTLLLASFVAVGTASPFSADVQVAAQSSGDKQFKLTQTPNKKFKGPNPLAELIHLHGKYGAPLPDILKSLIKTTPALNSVFSALLNQGSGDKTGSTVAYNSEDYDSEYFVDVEIGTPPQTLPLNLDTGSSDLWVFSSDTPQTSTTDHKLYSPAKSSTSRKLEKQSWKVQYGDGSGASGDVFKDTVSIANVTADNQAVQVAVSVAQSIAEDPSISGILGMASSSANMVTPTRQTTFFDNIAGDLKEPLFTANLQKGNVGTYNFGYIDDSEYIGDIHYTPIDRSSPYWRIKVDGFQIGKDGDFQSEPIYPIVDTGTTLLLLPDSMVKKYYAQIKGAYLDPQYGMMLYPCSTTPPDFIFHIGDYRGIVPGNYINYATATSQYCYGGIQSLGNAPFPVLGDILLKAQFVVFQRGTLSVGFANKKTVSD